MRLTHQINFLLRLETQYLHVVSSVVVVVVVVVVVIVEWEINVTYTVSKISHKMAAVLSKGLIVVRNIAMDFKHQ